MAAYYHEVEAGAAVRRFRRAASATAFWVYFAIRRREDDSERAVRAGWR